MHMECRFPWVKFKADLHCKSHPPAKSDIGVNVDLPYILLFKISHVYEGTIYPMPLAQNSSELNFMKLNVGIPLKNH